MLVPGSGVGVGTGMFGGLFAVRKTVTSELVEVSPCANEMSDVIDSVPE